MMNGIKAKEREIVVPGTALASGMEYLPAEGAYRDGAEIRSSVLGVVFFKGGLVRVVPLGGRYIPKRGDIIIGLISDIRFSSWVVNINGPYEACLRVSEASNRYLDTKYHGMSEYFQIGDSILTEITNVDEAMNVDVTMRAPGLAKLKAGSIIEVESAKVPRIIGKSGSMVNMVKEATGCQIIVGQNGLVWIQGKDKKSEEKALQIISVIEDQAHTDGLTEKIRELLGLPKLPAAQPGPGMVTARPFPEAAPKGSA